jgi:hypothetical protein
MLIGWFVICPTNWANTNLPHLQAANSAQIHEVWNVIKTPLSEMEQRLFADVSDGKLDDFTLFDAAVIASGEDDPAAMVRYRERMAAWVEELRQTAGINESPRKQVELIFDFLHSKVLCGKYDIECTDIRLVLERGRFNCVSATVLFNCLAGDLGLSCCSLETPGHTLGRVFLPSGPLDVETTCPRWFHLQHDPAKQAEALEQTLGRKAGCDKSKLREITPIQLTAMIYYNRGVEFLAEKRFIQAAAANSKSLRLDPLNSTARGNFLATINNWAIELGKSNQFSEAAALLRQGLAFDPHYDAFAQNFVHIHYQWSQKFCKEGRYREAAELLNQAASDLPDRNYLNQAMWDVYRRWSLSMFEANHIDQAFAVFAEARSRHGACQDELQCELKTVIEYGKKLISQNRFEEARQIFDRALILQPEASVLHDGRNKIAETSK